MNRTIEEARNYLKDDLEDYPYVLSNPLGHSGTKRKILSYFFACLLGGETKPNCVDWLYQYTQSKPITKSIIFNS